MAGCLDTICGGPSPAGVRGIAYLVVNPRIIPIRKLPFANSSFPEKCAGFIKRRGFSL